MGHRMDVRHGDLFAPVTGERFDLILFNPPFGARAARRPRSCVAPGTWRSDSLLDSRPILSRAVLR